MLAHQTQFPPDVCGCVCVCVCVSVGEPIRLNYIQDIEGVAIISYSSDLQTA